MIVLKFGGTSVGSAIRIRKLAELINDDKPKIVVLSAMSGTTNALVEIAYQLQRNKDKATELAHILKDKYKLVVHELFSNENYVLEGQKIVDRHFDCIFECFHLPYEDSTEKTILAQGELLSTSFLHLYLKEQAIDSVWMSALNFMRIDKDGEPDEFYIQENLKRIMQQHTEQKLFITQGFICRTSAGKISNLGRGGSDYTASIVGAALHVGEIQIWTDIDGMHNNDPRYVENTAAIAKLSFDEAAELAYFGAKILHPLSIRPAKEKNIPVRLKNTMAPTAQGTLISQEISGDGIKAIAAKDAITVVKIVSDRMLMAYGFMRNVFEVFERHKTPIDMVATSEVAVSISLDNPFNLEHITQELQQYGQVEVDNNLSIICIVGNYISNKGGIAAKIFQCLENISVRMISYGGSRHNVSILVKEDDKQAALKALNQLFD